MTDPLTLYVVTVDRLTREPLKNREDETKMNTEPFFPNLSSKSSQNECNPYFSKAKMLSGLMGIDRVEMSYLFY